MQIKKLDGELYKFLVINGYENLKANYHYVDSLNVFPVPDGDTGINMKMTIEGGANEIYNIHEPNIYEMSKKLSRGMLMGARGNSGVILSQLFRGISKGFEGKEQVDAIRLAQAFEKGVEQAYKAVMKPVEGTILTVSKDGANKMALIANSKMSINEFFREYLQELRESLQRTPELLPVLKEAGVVDSGAAGLVYIVEGMLKYLEGDQIVTSTDLFKVDKKSMDFVPANDPIEFGYCTEFILELKKDIDCDNFDEKEILNEISPIGNSIVIVKDENIIKVHIHTLTPGAILNAGQKYGEFIKLKIENMTVQHNETNDVQHVEEGECPCGEVHSKPIERPTVRKKYAIVSVATGEGLCEVFKSLGADFIVSGGQSMNPSTEDFIRGFDTLNAENIIVFPNNKNIILAATQAAKIYTESKITVIETKTLPQGYSALTMIDLSLELDQIIEDLNMIIDNVVSGQVTYSIRDTEIAGVKITKGDFIGLCDSKIVTAKKSKIEAVKDLLRKCGASEKDALTIIYGKDVAQREVNTIRRHIERNYTNLEVDVIQGDQEVYSYLLALE